MFEQARYLQNSFSLVFPEVRSIVSKEQEAYSQLRTRYFPAKVISTSPEPEGDKLLFQSHHGYSQIAVGSSNVTLNVIYSPEWQTEPNNARDYMTERSGLLFDVLDALQTESPLFGGSVTRVQIPSQENDRQVATFVAKTFAGREAEADYHDVIVRTTIVVDDLFFSNITIQNYRVWNVGLPIPSVYRISRAAATERGIEIISDFNSRFAFNEDRHFELSRETALELLDRNFETVGVTISRVLEEASEYNA